MVREWPDTRHVYYGTTAERLAFPAAGEAPGALFGDYDDGILYKWDGAAWVAFATSVTAAPANAEYLTLALDATLTQERVFTPNTPLVGTDGGAGTAYQLDLPIKNLVEDTTPIKQNWVLEQKFADDAFRKLAIGTLLKVGWGLNFVRVDANAPGAKYTSWETAISSEPSGQLFVLGVGVFSQTSTALPNGSTVISLHRSSGSRLTGYVVGGVDYGLVCAGSAYLRNLFLDPSAAVGNHAAGVYVVGEVILDNCESSPQANGSGKHAYGVDVKAATTCTVDGGVFAPLAVGGGGAVAYGVQAVAGATVTLNNARFKLTANFFTGAGTFKGTFIDDNGQLWKINGAAGTERLINSYLQASDGNPDPAWSTDAAGNLQGAPDLVIDLDERSTSPGTPAAGFRRLLAAVDGFWQVDDGGSTTPIVAEHFRSGMRVEYVDAGDVRVSAGALEFNGLLLKEQQDSGLIALATGGNWLSGSEGANMWAYIYATDDGAGGCTFKLSDEPPLYHECDTASLVFFAQVNGEPAAGATVFNYDNDTGEANIRAGDELRAWTDSDYGTVRGGLKVVSVNTGTNEFTVVANAVNLADNDYLTIVKGTPRYRQYAGVWYRCLGAVRNDGSSNLYPIFPRNGQNIVQYADAPSNHRALSLGTQTSATDVALATFIPPYSVQALAQVTLESGTGSKYIIMRPDGNTASIALLQGVPAMAFTLLIQCDYFQEIEYLVSASTEASIDIVGWEEIV